MKQIKKIISLTFAVIGMVGVMSLTPLTTSPASAALCTGSPIDCAKSGAGATGTSSGTTDLPGLIKKIVNILLFLIGTIAVIMIIIGGLRYVTSGGDSSGVTGAKNTILYAVIGLVVAVLAYAIVNFVLTNVK